MKERNGVMPRSSTVTMPTAGGGEGGGACAVVVGLHADKATTAASAASVFNANPMSQTPAFALDDLNFPYIAALRNSRKRTKMLSAMRRRVLLHAIDAAYRGLLARSIVSKQV